MKKLKILFSVILLLSLTFCSRDGSNNKIEDKIYNDATFTQEYHIGYPVGVGRKNNDVRSMYRWFFSYRYN